MDNRDFFGAIGRAAAKDIERDILRQAELLSKMVNRNGFDVSLDFATGLTGYDQEEKDSIHAANMLYFYGIEEKLREIMNLAYAKIVTGNTDSAGNPSYSKENVKKVINLFERHGFLSLSEAKIRKPDKAVRRFEKGVGITTPRKGPKQGFDMDPTSYSLNALLEDISGAVNSGDDEMFYKQRLRALLYVIVCNIREEIDGVSVSYDARNTIFGISYEAFLKIAEMFLKEHDYAAAKSANEYNKANFMNPDGTSMPTPLALKFRSVMRKMKKEIDMLKARQRNAKTNVVKKDFETRIACTSSLLNALVQVYDRVMELSILDYGDDMRRLEPIISDIEKTNVSAFEYKGTAFTEEFKDKYDGFTSAIIGYGATVGIQVSAQNAAKNLDALIAEQNSAWDDIDTKTQEEKIEFPYDEPLTAADKDAADEPDDIPQIEENSDETDADIAKLIDDIMT